MSNGHKVLLTGATGFVGGAVWPALIGDGYEVRGLTRDANRALAHWPDREWAQGDVETGEDLDEALRGCEFAIYLVHGMGRGGEDYRQRDRLTARRFAQAAANAGISRILYLGGVEPQGPPSEHLASRLEVGEELRSGAVQALELRASMIVGYGSLSWWIVRDLAARLPFMVLPRWMSHRTEPVAIEDVVMGLVRGLAIPLTGSACFDLPGPEALTEKEIVVLTAQALGLRTPVMLDVPVLSPWLSSHWIHVVTRAEWEVAREIVLGLGRDLLARNHDYWELVGHPDLISFREAAKRATELEQANGKTLGGVAGWLEAAMRRARPAHK
jgi:uncharacterized protein YbjT (DUF2867 family)